MNVCISFQQIQINQMEANSSIANGENHLQNWNWQGKYNFGNGISTGINYIVKNINNVYDQDIIDQNFNNTQKNNPQPNVQM